MHFADQRLSAALMQQLSDQRAETSASSYPPRRAASRLVRRLMAVPARIGARLAAAGTRTARHA